MNLPLVSVITVNYNRKKYLRTLFNSLHRLNYPRNKLEIIMVDNGSSDGSVELVNNDFPTVKIIKNEMNNYCKANNIGIKSAKGELIALINNDLKLARNWLIELVNLVGSDSSIGAATSRVLFPDGKLQGAGHYEFPNFYWSDRGFKEDNKNQYNKIEEVPSISHCAVLYRKECLADGDLLDEDFNMYMEDVDMSIRLRQKGWRLFYVPKSVAYHKFHGSADGNLVNFYCEKNRLLLIAKHYPQKLADAFFGSGYFTALNNRDDLIMILSEVFKKLIKHQSPEIILSLYPSIFKSLNRILNLEKDYLVKQVDSLRSSILQKDTELSNLKEKNDQHLNLISQKDQYLKGKDTEIIQLKDEINQQLKLVAQKEEQLSEKNQLLQQKDTELSVLKDKIEHQLMQKNQSLAKQAEELSQREQLLYQKYEEISLLKDKINQGLNLLSQKEFTAQQRETEISNLKNEINQHLSSISQKDQQLSERDQILQGKDTQIFTLQDKINSSLDLLAQKDQHLQGKDTEITQLKDKINQGLNLLSQKEFTAQQRETEISNLKNEINQHLSSISQKDQLVQQANFDITQLKEIVSQHLNLISQKDQQLSEKGHILENKNLEIANLNDEIDRIYRSETYRFIARPIWKILDTTKGLRIKPKTDFSHAETLVIKPYCVSSDETERALEYLKNSALKQNIVLLANLFEDEYNRLLKNSNIYDKIFYCSGINKLNYIELAKLIFGIRRRKFQETILLINNPVYQGYRKGKLLASFSGAKTINVYFIGTSRLEPLVSLNHKKMAWSFLHSNLSLFFILAFFLIFIVLPLKLRKFFKR